MNWLDKLEYLIFREHRKRETRDTSDPFFYDVCLSEDAWVDGELEALTKDYPWLPEAYFDFIKKYDGISIAFVDFYGSHKGDALPLDRILKETQPLLKGKYFPFGKDPGGGHFLFNQRGQVAWWKKDDYDFENEPEIIANSLEELVGECLLGKRYEEFNFIDKDRFYDFLKSERWA